MENASPKQNGTREKRRDMQKRLVGIACFAALAFIVSLATSWIKVQNFLSVDLKDAVITIGAFIFGPLSALPMSAITAILEAVTVGSTGPIGAIMDFVSTSAFSLTAAFIYKYRRSLSGAIIGFVAAVFVYSAVMVPMNLLLTPIYVQQPYEVIKSMILPLLLPFNFAKAMINSAFSIIIYKPLSVAMSYVGLKEKRENSFRLGAATLIMLALSLAFVAVAVVVFIIIN